MLYVDDAGLSLLGKNATSETNQEDSNYPAGANCKRWIPPLTLTQHSRLGNQVI